MKRPIHTGVLAAALTLLCAGSAAGQTHEKGVFGLGLIVGEPTGLSAKLYLSDDTAVDAAVGWAMFGGGFHVHADYLWHPWVLESRDSFVLPAYVGLGGRLMQHRRGRGAGNDVHLGARAVVGMLFDFKDVPLDVFAEVAGVFEYRLGGDDPDHRGFALALNAGAGVRYYF
jgi:hypothetical protein